MKKTYLTVSLLLLSVFSYCQTSDCDGDRYINDVFVNYNETNNVVYGNATTLGGVNMDLEMDVFEPEDDALEMRPLIILVHGGGFIGGNRSEMDAFCIDFAHKGYVTATISYRLLDAIVLDSIGFTEEVVCAVSDLKAAIRYFREDADTDNLFKINPDKIYIGGISAGAVTCCHVAYLDENDNIPEYVQNHVDNHGGLDGESSSNTEYSSDVQGVLNYSGGLLRSNWINSGEAPLYSAHDENDNVVSCSYGTSSLFFFDLYNYGACILNDIAGNAGIYNTTYIVPNSDEHVGYFMNTQQANEVLDETYNFLHYINCGIVDINENEINKVSVFPNPSDGNIIVEGVNSETEFKVYDLSGRLVYSNPELIIDDRLDLTDLTSGTYLLQLQEAKTKQILHSQHIIID